MITSIRAMVAGAAGLVLLLGAPGLADAQTWGDPSPDVARRGATPHFNPNEGPQPNGCFKLCPLDTNPCDPPEFKRADGRCNLRD